MREFRLKWCAGLVSLTASSAMAAPTSTTLVNFTGFANGQNPYAGVIADGSGNLYGTTTSAGSNNNGGTVFKIAAGTNTLSTLVTFTGTAYGANPNGGLIADGSGNLYGTTYHGGSSDNYGTVFKIAAGTNTLSTLATFTGTNGANPEAGLIADGSGNLYGTTYGGGSGYVGTVFKIAAGTNTLSTLATFTDTANGAKPVAGLIADDSGNLYGTTEQGGSSGVGTVFKIAAGTNTLSTLATFTGTNGANPEAGLIADGSGNLYGTTVGGGSSNRGTVFKIAAGTNTLSTLATFTGTANGAFPYAGLIADASGNLYGTTYGGGSKNDGTVFEIAAGTNTLSTLATFTGTANGAFPYAGLIADGSGNLYGTTYYGGSVGAGTVFELSGTGFAVPEPSSLTLAGIGSLALLRRRRR